MLFDLKVSAGVVIGLFVGFAVNILLDLLRARKTHKELIVEPYSHQVERGRVFAKQTLRAYPQTGRVTLQQRVDKPNLYVNQQGFYQGIVEVLGREGGSEDETKPS
jgi:hypothetical protein